MADMAGMGAKTVAELYKKKMQGTQGPIKTMNKGGDTSFDAKMKAQDAGVIDKKTGSGRKRFMEAAKSVKLGKRLLIPVALGITAVQALKSKMKKNKEKNKDNKPEVDRNTLRGGDRTKIRPKNKMGGGLASATKKLKAKGLRRGGTGVLGGIGGSVGRKLGKSASDIMAAARRDKGKDKARFTKKMGGGMMTRSMGYVAGGMTPRYKAGKSVMAKGCKLGRKKPTKMY